MPTPSTKLPTPKLPSIFPPKLTDLKDVTKTQKKEVKKLLTPILPKAMKVKNNSKQLLERIKGTGTETPPAL